MVAPSVRRITPGRSEMFTCRFEADSFRLYLHSGDEVWSQVEDYRLRPRSG